MSTRKNAPLIQELLIELRFADQDFFPAAALASALELMIQTLQQVETNELETYRAELSEIPEAVFDAVRYRMGQFERSGLSVSGSRHGSLVIECIPAAMALWLLNVTIGETLKEAWKDSRAHRALKNTLSKHLGAKASEIAERITNPKYGSRGVEVVAEVVQRGTTVVVVATVSQGNALVLPSASRALASDDA